MCLKGQCDSTEQPEAASQPETAEDYDTNAPIGAEVGNQLADFATEIIGGGEFRLSDYRGKAVFINLWATYCAPCVEELPYFEQLAQAHPDDLVILAIHHSVGAKKAEKWKKRFDEIVFCAIFYNRACPFVSVCGFSLPL